MTTIQVKIIDPKIGKTIDLPKYSTPGSAAMDLRACLEQPLCLKADTSELIPSGIAIYIADPNIAGFILPRSGLGHKNGIVLGNLTGLIDSDYQGPLMISLWNRSGKDFLIQPGDRIAQIVFMPVVQAQLELVNEFIESKRGSGGFGHTGTQ